MSIRPFSPFMAANNNFAFTHNFSSLFFWFRDIKGNKMKEVLSADIKTSRGIKCIFHPRREWHSKWGEEIRSQGRMWGERVGEEVAEKRRVGVREEKAGKGRTGGLRGMWNLRGAGFGAREGGQQTAFSPGVGSSLRSDELMKAPQLGFAEGTQAVMCLVIHYLLLFFAGSGRWLTRVCVGALPAPVPPER